MSPLFALILLSTLIRLVFAWAIGLGVDESYMVSAGRVLGLGYFDHPPIAWWLSWLAAHLAGTEAPVVVRLPFILLFALSTWLVARIGRLVGGERTGFWAAVLLNLSPVFGVTTGSWVLPDGPLDAALLAGALCLMHAVAARERVAWRWWAATGLCAGLALASKYSAVLTMTGALVFLASSRIHRHWLTRPHPYVAAAIALSVFAPVIIWNATHGWASFAFQGGRAMGLRFHPLAPLVVLAGEALFVLPWIWAPMMIVAVQSLRRGPTAWKPWLLCCLATPPILAFTMIAAWSSQRILYHWAAPGYLMLFPLLGRAVAERERALWVRRTIVGTGMLVIAAVAVISTQERLDIFGPALGRVMGKDPTAEGLTWTSIRTDLLARGLLHPGSVVATTNWRDAGKIAQALGPDVTVICLNRDNRQFGLAYPPASYVGRKMLVLIVDHPNEVERQIAPLFARITTLPPAAIAIGGRVLQPVTVLQADDLLRWPP